MALLDQVTQGMQKLGAPEEQAGAATNQTQAAARLTSGLTGKATSGAGPQMSNLQEQVAQNQARLAAEQQAKSQQMQAEQLSTAGEQQQQEMQLAEEEIDEARLEQVDRYTQKATALLNDFNREGRKIDFRKDGAKLEQLGFAMRLADDKYLSQLEEAGTRQRLDDMANFEQAAMEDAFRDERSLLENNFEFRRLMDAKDREFDIVLANMGLDAMVEMVNASADEENSRLKWQALGQVASAGVQAGAAWGQGKLDQKRADEAAAKALRDKDTAPQTNFSSSNPRFA